MEELEVEATVDNRQEGEAIPENQTESSQSEDVSSSVEAEQAEVEESPVDSGEAEPASEESTEAEPTEVASTDDEPSGEDSSEEIVIEAESENELVEEVQELPFDPSLKAMIEAIVYLTDEPLTAAQIANGVDRELEDVEKALAALVDEYAQEDRGLSVREVAGGYKMSTKAEHHESIRQFVRSLKPPLKLSLAALETLAVIAYKQPITSPEIMEIRGVQGGGVLKTLLDRKLITTAGRKAVIGKPILYKTTKDFLLQFGLKDLAELPSLKEFEELRRLALSDDEPLGLPTAEERAAEERGDEPESADSSVASASSADQEKPRQEDPSPEEPARQEPPVEEPSVDEPPAEEAPVVDLPTEVEPPAEEESGASPESDAQSQEQEPNA